MSQARARPRIGLLWRGDRAAEPPSEKASERLGPLIDAFDDLPVVVDHVVYSDDAVDEVRAQLLECDGVLVWVNPIQDGQNRAVLDRLLREVAAQGVWVSAHPDTILTLGTKEVLYRARKLPWGSDVELYRGIDDFTHRFRDRLTRLGKLVVKQGRGNGGDGVWSVELVDKSSVVDWAAPVIVRDARATDGASIVMPFGEFLKLIDECLAWSDCLIDQPFQERLAEGMLRCYFTQDRIVGFARQWPKRGLLGPAEAVAAASAPPSVIDSAEAPQYQEIRRVAETQWLPALLVELGLEARSLPVIWDADLLFGDETATGEDAYVLCEINTSAVWPFPPSAARVIAEATLRALSVE